MQLQKGKMLGLLHAQPAAVQQEYELSANLCCPTAHGMHHRSHNISITASRTKFHSTEWNCSKFVLMGAIKKAITCRLQLHELQVSFERLKLQQINLCHPTARGRHHQSHHMSIIDVLSSSLFNALSEFDGLEIVTVEVSASSYHMSITDCNLMMVTVGDISLLIQRILLSWYLIVRLISTFGFLELICLNDTELFNLMGCEIFVYS